MLDLAQDFLREFSRDHAESTVTGYRSDLSHFSDHLRHHDIDIRQIDENHIRDYLVSLKRADYASQTIRTRYQSIRQFLQYLNDNKVIDSNPALRIKIGNYAHYDDFKQSNSSDGARAWITKQELNDLLQNVPQPVVRNRSLVMFIYYTACWSSSASRLRLTDINLDDYEAKITVPQSGDRISVQWQPNLQPLLESWIDEYRPEYPTAASSPYVFVTEQSARIVPAQINRIVREGAKKAGIQRTIYVDKNGNERKRVTAKTLRQSFGIHWLMPPRSGSLNELSNLLAHTSMQTTRIYEDISDVSTTPSYSEFAPSIDDTNLSNKLSQACELCGLDTARLVLHHTSYIPEEVIEICKTCHWHIHHSDAYDHLRPERTRKQAMKDGWVPERWL